MKGDYITLFIDKVPGRKIALRKLGCPTNEPVEFAFYLFPKLSIETSYREHIKRRTAERMSRGEFEQLADVKKESKK